ncbi:MAG: type II secretion system F family protein [Kiritimatiellae bacterium]|jgi:type II secretory pathway component PulF|nr:type II secretion system F family protein [Kiritimatiellia bacterium]MDD4340924.1 type II secretion system F family protein [Kiritimatiellia bacterium]MDY0149867.1 type II secretion system F family protein [Kiritimatiellia bacterium]
MAQFRYIAKSRDGERQEGVLDAPDKRTVMRALSQRGLVPISVTDGKPPPAALTPAARAKDKRKKTETASAIAIPKKGAHKNWFRFERGHRAHSRMKLDAMLLVTSELSDLLASGMTLGSALHALAQRATGSSHDAIIVNLRDEVVAGASLSAALAKWPESFPTLYVSMVKAGEASGQLPGVLERLVTHYERVQAAREKVSMALVYPLIVTLVGVGAMIFMMIFVVPRFSAMFEELGGTLPLPTRILIGLSKGLLQYGWVLVIGLFFLGVAVRRALKTPAGTEWKDRAMLRLPTVGNIVRANAFANFAHTLSTLLANGVQVLQALAIVEHTVGNSIIARAIRSARERVTDGSTISRPLSQGGVFPRLLTDMLSVGEESGDMVSALEHIGRRYDNDLDRAVKLFTTILEPVMMLLIAVGVGFMAISMLLAVFELTSGLNA